LRAQGLLLYPSERVPGLSKLRKFVFHDDGAMGPMLRANSVSTAEKKTPGRDVLTAA